MPFEDKYACELIIQELAALRRDVSELKSLREDVAIMKALKDEVLTLKKIISDLRDDRSQVQGAMWAMSKIGAGVVAMFGIVGWIAIHGLPMWLKDAFSR